MDAFSIHLHHRQIARLYKGGGQLVRTAAGSIDEANRSSWMYDVANVSDTEPTTVGVIRTQEKDHFNGDAQYSGSQRDTQSR